MGQCKGCRAKIHLVRMAPKEGAEVGAAMPVEAKWIPGDGAKTLVVLDEDTGFGHVIVKAPGHVLGREPHWGNCPAYKQKKIRKQQLKLF